MVMYKVMTVNKWIVLVINGGFFVTAAGFLRAVFVLLCSFLHSSSCISEPGGNLSKKREINIPLFISEVECVPE